MSIKKISNGSDLDKTYCNSISKSISEIIRLSLNEEFRKQSFELFGVSCTRETQKEINKRLMSIIQNKRILKQNYHVLNPKVTSHTNESSEIKGNNSSFMTTTDSDSQSSLQSTSFSQKNWLQSSSENDKESLKKKFCSFSQPVSSQTKVDYGENDFFTYSTSHSDSLALSEHSSGSLLSQENTNSFSEPSDIDTGWCKEKFKELFKNDACKYFKNNLKLKRNHTL